MVYSFARGLLRILYSILFPLKIEGKQHVPDEGPVLLCSNHISLLDPPAIGIWLDRKVSFFAKEELFKIPLLGLIIDKLGAIPVRRGAGDRKALTGTLQVLKNGGVVGIFPEGTRIKSGMIEEGKKGAAYFAVRSNAVVIPVYVKGPYRLFRKTRIMYGAPVNLDAYRESKANSAVLAEVSSVITDHIRKLAKQSIES